MELRQTITKTIDGFTYEITQLGALKGSQVFVRVLKMIGPAFATKKDVDFGKLLSGVNEEDLLYLINSFTPMTNVPGVGPLERNFDIHFVGRYMAMMKWLFACLEANYGDFLKDGSLAAAAQSVGQSASASNSQTGATGPSTAS